MDPLERRQIKLYHITGFACGLDALALLSASGYCSAGMLSVWLYGLLGVILLGAGVLLYQITMRLYIDDRRRQARAARGERLNKLRKEQKDRTN